MGSVGPVQITLEIEQRETTIGGSLAVEGTPPDEFFGWLELLDLLHRASMGGERTPAAEDLDADRETDPEC